MGSIGIHGAAASSGGGGAVTVADGADVVLGATTDAAVVTDTTGTISGKLRGLVKWAFERMPASLGTKTAANSFPVTVASDDDLHVHTHPVTATGTLSSTLDTVTVSLSGHSSVGARIVPSAGTLAGVLVFEASMNGTDYFGLQFRVVTSGHTATGLTYAAGLSLGSANHHISALLPGGCTNARVVMQSITAGSATITLNATAGLETSGSYIGGESVIPNPQSGVQLGGASTYGGEFRNVKVMSTNPGIDATKNGLVVVPWGLVEPGASATGYPFRLVAGRDPTSNAMRQLDLYDGHISSTAWNGLIVRPYMGSDGTNRMPTMDAYARRGFVEPVAATTGAAPAAATVGTSSAAAVSANASRKGLILTNTSANVISLSFDAAAVLYSGITLLSGASFTMDEFTFDAGEVRAIASVASSNLSVQEFT